MRILSTLMVSQMLLLAFTFIFLPQMVVSKEAIVKYSRNPYTMMVRANQIRVRKIPSMQAPAFTLLQKGALVTVLNEESQKKYQAVIDGLSYHEPFVKIRLGNGQLGWIFKGALTGASSSYKVTSIEQGDIMCYIFLADQQGKIWQRGVDFPICENKDRYINKYVMIAKTEPRNVMDCESSEPCGKSKSVQIITEIKIVR